MSGTRGYHTERPGTPVHIETDENVDKVRSLVARDCRLCVGKIPEEANVDKEMAIKTFKSKFRYQERARAKMFPENLSEDKKLAGKQLCYEILEGLEDAIFSKPVVTCDET
jgi:hypothetical protein